MALLVSFALVFAAGLVVGRLAWGPATGGPRAERSWLSEELNLTTEQRQQMERIWSDALGGLGAEHGDRRRALGEERERAIGELLTAEQKEQYEHILAQYHEGLQQLGRERQEAFERAFEQTREILTPEQREHYEKIMDRMHRRVPRRRPRRGERPTPGRPD